MGKPSLQSELEEANRDRKNKIGKIKYEHVEGDTVDKLTIKYTGDLPEIPRHIKRFLKITE